MISNKVPWTAEEDDAIMKMAISDREIAKLIGRSVSAIQSRRHRLKYYIPYDGQPSEKKENETDQLIGFFITEIK